MDARALISWRIPATQPFFPIGIRYIGYDDRAIIITYAAHTVSTFIFRNFSEDIRTDKAAHKNYLHKSFFPEHIKDIIVGKNESAILLQNGQIKYFDSAKNLMDAQHLSGVKSICSTTQNGFVLIKLGSNGSDFFLELHPDSFRDEASNIQSKMRRTFNISFDEIMGLQNTWHYSCFKIKELHFHPLVDNPFLQILLPDDIGDVNGCNEGNDSTILFLSIDNTFCSVHIDSIAKQPIVNPIVMCFTKIIDFWASKNLIFLLLESGTLEVLHAKYGESSTSKKSYYFGSNIQSYDYYEELFIFSNGSCVQYGLIEINHQTGEIDFNRKSIGLPGIVALTYLPAFQLTLMVSENCRFYSIWIQKKEKNIKQWTLIDDVQNHLLNVKYHLITLVSAYENLLEQQLQQQQALNVLKLKQSAIKTIQRNGNTGINYHFVAACSVTRNLPIQRHRNDSFTNIINVSNSLAYDQKMSFFVSIVICHTVMYANEFDANLWRLCCRWLNDKNEHVYANIELKKGQLSQPFPLTFIIHLQQKCLPNFILDISTVAIASKYDPNQSSVLISFPVRVEQPNYCDMMNISVSKFVEASSSNMDEENLICTVLALKSISLDEIFADKFDLDNGTQAKTLQCDERKAYTLYFLKQTLTAVLNPENGTLHLITKYVDLMQSFKKHLHGKIEKKLITQNNEQNVSVSMDALKAYCVSNIYLSNMF